MQDKYVLSIEDFKFGWDNAVRALHEAPSKAPANFALALEGLTPLNYDLIKSPSIENLEWFVQAHPNVAEITVNQLLEAKRTDKEGEPPIFFKLKAQPEPTEFIDSLEASRANVNAFERTQFLDSGYCDLFLNTISGYSKLWKREKKGTAYYAPYVALINSTMMGKSRLTAQLPKQGVFTITWCLRKSTNPSHRPARTTVIADWIETKDADERSFTQQACHLLYWSLERLVRFLEEKIPQEFRYLLNLPREQAIKIKYPNNRKIPLVKLTDEWATGIQKTGFWDEWKAKRPSNTDSNKTNEIIANQRPAVIKVRSKIALALELLLSKESYDELKTRASVVFVIDEARRLNTVAPNSLRFVWMRRAFKVLPYYDDSVSFFAVVTDTCSKLSNLAPSREADSSERMNSLQEQLFPPFTLVMSLDVWWNFGRWLDIPDSHEPAQIIERLHEYVKGKPAARITRSVTTLEKKLSRDLVESFDFMGLFGRAALFALYDGRKEAIKELGDSKSDCADEHTRFLMRKLLCFDLTQPDGEDTIRNNLGHIQALSIMGALLSIEVTAATKLATQLTSEHIRLVADVSKNRDCVYSLEVSEPHIALAAHKLILDGIVKWHQVLEFFLSSVASTGTSIGFRGEVAAQFLCVLAAQQCMDLQNPYSFPYIPLYCYIEALVGKEVFEECIPALTRDRMKEAYKNHFVRLTQFVKTFAKPNATMLYNYFLRSSGIYCRENEPVVDLILPIHIRDSQMDSTMDFVSKEKMTSLLIQVKLRKDFISGAQLQHWVQNVCDLGIVRDDDFVAILLELGPPHKFDDGTRLTFNYDRDCTMQPSNDSKKRKLQPETMDPLPGLFLFLKRPMPSQILLKESAPSEDDAYQKKRNDISVLDKRFQTLISGAVDPASFPTIEADHQAKIREMYFTQPYSIEMTKPFK